MATEVASLFGTLALVDNFTPGVNNALKGTKQLTSEMQNASVASDMFVGATKKGATALTSFGLASTYLAIDYDRAFTNIRSVTGQTTDEIGKLKDIVRSAGAEFGQSPLLSAEAYYDIVGGVSDATVHMSTFRASLQLAGAGQASLAASTTGLISAMNSYGFAADKATFATDVYSRSVAVGVGTLDEFVAAIGPIAGTAAVAKVSFDELGASVAFLTTKGNTASQAATRVLGAINALLKPNEAMKDGLRALGYASGQAAIENLGLAGTYQALNDAFGGNIQLMSEATGNAEANAAALALMDENYNSFKDTFEGGLDGSTLKQLEIQQQSVGYQWDQLKAKAESFMVSVGDITLPQLGEAAGQANFILDVLMKPIVDENALNTVMTSAPLSGQVMTYTIKPGDTAQDVADAFGITKDEAQTLINAQGGYITVGVDPSLDSFAASLGTTREEAQAIADAAGWAVSIPTEVTPEMVLKTLEERGLGEESYEAVKAELENAMAGGVRVDIPTRLTPQVIEDFAVARGITYAQAEAFLTDYFSGRTFSTQTKVGMTVTFYDVEVDEAVFREQVRKALGLTGGTATDTGDGYTLTMGDQRVALAAAIVIGSYQVVTGDEVSEETNQKVYEELHETADGIAAHFEEHPVDIRGQFFAITPGDVISGLEDMPKSLDELTLRLEIALDKMELTVMNAVNDMASSFNTLKDGVSFLPGMEVGERQDLVDTSGKEAEIAANEANLAVMTGEARSIFDVLAASKTELIGMYDIAQTKVLGINVSHPFAEITKTVDKLVQNREMIFTVYVNVVGGNGVYDTQAYNEVASTNAGIEFRAAGGDIVAGRDYIVGEEGPELFRSATSGAIVPNHELASAGGGGITINGNIAIYGVTNVQGMYDALIEVDKQQSRPAFAGVMG